MKEDIQIRRLGGNDVRSFEALIYVFETAFETAHSQPASAAHLAKLLARPDFVVCAAFAGDVVVGGLTAYELTSYYTEAAELFIYDIAVHPEYRRTGIGQALMGFLQDYAAGVGSNEIFVAADREDSEALAFYEGTGGTPADVVHFSYDIAQRQ